MTTPAAQLYALPEPVQDALVRLVHAVAGMDALEKFAAHESLDGVTRAWLAMKTTEVEPAAEVAVLCRDLVGAIGMEAAPAHLKEGATT